jgi:hypothetical protein
MTQNPIGLPSNRKSNISADPSALNRIGLSEIGSREATITGRSLGSECANQKIKFNELFR